jgi:GT2 family glycosyltransferase
MNAPRLAEPTVSVIITVCNEWEYTRQCRQRLAENTADVDQEVIVVDNGSSDGAAEGMAAWH